MPEPDPFDYDAHLRACAQGDRQALQRLYRQESPRLLGVARRLVKDTALAEDIVHEAFLKIWSGAAGFDPQRGTARGWIFSITRHLALNLLRGRSRQVLLGDTDHVAFEGLSEVDEHDRLVHAGRLDACLEHLPVERRRCIVHAYVDGYSHGQIAQLLATPLGTVKAWIKRSLVALRECMG